MNKNIFLLLIIADVISLNKLSAMFMPYRYLSTIRQVCKCTCAERIRICKNSLANLTQCGNKIGLEKSTSIIPPVGVLKQESDASKVIPAWALIDTLHVELATLRYGRKID